MELKVLFSEDPALVLRSADEFLSAEPVLHNLILSILHSRVAQGDPGRYWIAFHGEKTVGVVVQSPLEYPATLTPMEPRAVVAIEWDVRVAQVLKLRRTVLLLGCCNVFLALILLACAVMIIRGTP